MNTHTHVIKSQVAMALSIGTGKVLRLRQLKNRENGLASLTLGKASLYRGPKVHIFGVTAPEPAFTFTYTLL